MNHAVKRIGLCVLGASSIAAFLAAVQPRIIAWNEASNAATIAAQRAANCRLVSPAVKANIIPLDPSGRTLPAGTHVCDRAGVTGQINGTGAIDFVKQGHTETIQTILKNRKLIN